MRARSSNSRSLTLSSRPNLRRKEYLGRRPYLGLSARGQLVECVARLEDGRRDFVAGSDVGRIDSTFIIASSRSPLMSSGEKWRGSTRTVGSFAYTFFIARRFEGLSTLSEFQRIATNEPRTAPVQ